MERFTMLLIGKPGKPGKPSISIRAISHGILIGKPSISIRAMA